MKKLLPFLLIFLSLTVAHAQNDTPRRFLMGFTPFPYDVTPEAVLDTYATLDGVTDLIVHHFDNGVPWTEALAKQPYSQHIQDDWKWRQDLTPAGKKILATVAAISFDRTGLADYRGDEDNMPLPAPFNAYSFDHRDVIAAYLNYCDSIIATFKPDYFMFGIEVNLLMKLAPEQWDAYMVLHKAVYAYLKKHYPALPIFVSVTGIDLLEGYGDANHANQVRALADILPYTDILGLSVYPYMTSYGTNSIPDQLFDQLAALTDKPLAVTETGYPAQAFTLHYQGVQLDFAGDEAKQAAWIRYLLDSAQAHSFVFVVNFVLRDYDGVWRWLGSHDDDLTIVWRDTGLYGENGEERQALGVWRDWLARPYQA